MTKRTRIEFTYGELPQDPRRSPWAISRWPTVRRLWHVVCFGLSVALAYLSDRFHWPVAVERTFEGLVGLGVLLIFAWFGLRYFLASTRGKPGARKKAVMDYLGIPGESEPEPSRRLWQWQCMLYVLLVPGAYFFVTFPALSFASFACLGMGRVLIARRRREWGGKPQRLNMMPTLAYVGMLLMAGAATVLDLV